MTIKIKKQSEKGLRQTAEEMSGVDLSLCYQCKKCASGCPVTKYTQSPPSEIIRRLHLGAGDELLESDLVWMCLSCETCYGRCPMDINIPAVMIMGYKLGSGSLMQDVEKFPSMLAKGKMAVLPPLGAEKKVVKRIFDRSKQAKGKKK